jgi:translation initiation factor 2B subunit (eIF-2B alpha/beta/delta family)
VQLLEACDAITLAQPEMAPLHNLAANIRDCVTMSDDDDALGSRLSDRLNEVEEEEEHAAGDAASRAADLIHAGSSVLTISSSSAVRETILNHPEAKSLRIIVPESRPMREGVLLAEGLSQAGLDVTLIADLAFGSYLEDLDYFLCGADAVTEQFLVNKIGTSVMSSAVLDSGGKNIAVFSEIKVISGDVYVFSLGFHSPDEIDDHPTAGYSVENRYFDATPIENFSKLVTNRSVYAAKALRELISRRDLSSDAE